MSATTDGPAHWSALRVVLTSTELDVLERSLAAEEGTAPEEEPDEVDPSALQEAVRSLTVRGVLAPDGRLGDDMLGVWLGTALAARFAPGVVLSVVRTVAGRVEDSLATDLVGDPHAGHGDRLVHLTHRVACVEDVLPGGVQLALGAPGQAADEVVSVCLPADASAGTGPAFTHALAGLARPDGALAHALGRPTSLLRLESDVPRHVAAAGGSGGPAVPPPSCHLVALGPRGCWVADLPAGPPATVAEFRPVGPGWVEDWVRARAEPFSGQGTMAG